MTMATTSSTSNNNNNNNNIQTQPKSENPFDLIQLGIIHESYNDHWNAANSFGEATQILFSLSQYEDQKSQSTHDETRKKRLQNVSQLYLDECFDYLQKARCSLIKALTVEMEHDTSPQDVSEEESHWRIEIFKRIYAATATSRVDPKQMEEEYYQLQQLSIEERLAALNATLPATSLSGRQREIVDRLKGLGVHIPSHSPSVGLEQEMDEEEELDLILEQAKDEVGLRRREDDVSTVTFEELNGGERNETNQVEALVEQSKRQIEKESGEDPSIISLQENIPKEIKQDESKQVEALLAQTKKQIQNDSINDEELAASPRNEDTKIDETASNKKNERTVQLIYKTQAYLEGALAFLDEDEDERSTDEEDTLEEEVQKEKMARGKKALMGAQLALEGAMKSLK